MTVSGKTKELDLGQQIEFLRKISFFNGFDDHELKQFLQVSKWLRVPAKTMIIRENTTERAFYILVRGEVQVEKRRHGHKEPLLLTTLSSGDCFGEMAMVSEIRRTADVVAKGECFILRVEPDIVSTSNVFLQLKFYKRFCESLVSRLDSANKLVAGSTSRSSEVKPGIQPEQIRQQDPAAPQSPLAQNQPQAKTEADLLLPPIPDREARLNANKLHQRIKPEALLPINLAVGKELEDMLAQGAEVQNTRRFVDFILLDPVLCCRVLQTANSPFFRRAAMVSTVPHAIVLIGIKQVQEVVASTITTAKPLRPFSGFAHIAKDFGRHAVLVAKIAEMLREVLRVQVPADIYLCGLFHDLGMLILDQLSPNFYAQLNRPSTAFADLSKAEKEYIGGDHAQVGAWLGEGIGLPQAYLDAMRFHHQPEKATTNRLAVALVSLADSFASMKGACLGPTKPGIEPILRSTAWGLLQEEHRPFQEVNIAQFVGSFVEELDKVWMNLNDDILR